MGVAILPLFLMFFRRRRRNELDGGRWQRESALGWPSKSPIALSCGGEEKGSENLRNKPERVWGYGRGGISG